MLLSLDKLRVKKLGAGDFFTDGGGLAESIFFSGLKSILSLSTAGYAATTQVSCKNEILKLVEIYRRVCSNNIDADSYLYVSELLMLVGDTARDIPFAGGRPNVYLEIVNVPISHLQMNGQDKGVESIRLRAEGKAELFKP